MASVVIDSADHYSTADLSDGNGKWVSDGPVTIQVGGARTGPQCILMQGGAGGQMRVNAGTITATSSVGCGFKFTALPASGIRLITYLAEDSTEIYSVRLTPSATLKVTVNGFFVAESASTINLDEWFFLDSQVTMGGAYIAVVYRGSGAETFLSGSGAGAGQITNLIIGDFTTDVDILVDDVYVNDDSGGIHTGREGHDLFAVYCLRPISSDTSQWAPNTGTNLSCVSDSTPDGSATFNEGTNVGDKDLFEMTQGNLGTSQIVQMVSWSGGTFEAEIGGIVKIDGTEYPGPSVPQFGGYSGYVLQVLNLSPATGLAFTGAEIDAARWGYYLTVAGDAGAKVTQFVVEVTIPNLTPPPSTRVLNFCF